MNGLSAHKNETEIQHRQFISLEFTNKIFILQYR